MAVLEGKGNGNSYTASVGATQVTTGDGKTITIPTGISADQASAIDKGCQHTVNPYVYPVYRLGDFGPMAFANQDAKKIA